MAERPEKDAPAVPPDDLGADMVEDKTSADARPPTHDEEEDEPTVLSKAAAELLATGVTSAVPSTEPAPAPSAAVATEPMGAPRSGASSPVAKGEMPSPKPPRTAARATSSSAEDESSAVETSPRMNAVVLPIHLPGTVEIRTVEHDELLDETEVKTVPGGPFVPRVSDKAVKAAGATADDDESVTTKKPAVRIGFPPPSAAAPSTERDADGETGAITHPAASEPLTKPGLEAPTRPGVDPATKPGIEPPTRPGLPDAPTSPRTKAPADVYGDDESVTKRGHAVESYDDDSITVEGAALRAAVGSAPREPIEDDVDGTTNKRRAPALPADEEGESITMEAPGPLTNMLRVIASDPPPMPLAKEEPEAQNETAVMANAPVVPYRKKQPTLMGIAPQGSLPAQRPANAPPTATVGPAAVATAAEEQAQIDITSESGLRIARVEDVKSERASLSALGVPPGPQPVAPSMAPPDVLPHAPVPLFDASANRAADVPPVTATPSLHEYDFGAKMPRYGLLVGVVATISLLVPVAVYVVLQRPAELMPAPPPAIAASDPVKRGDPTRSKAAKPAPPPPSASSSAPPKKPWWKR